jgi:hypothetical protein
MLATLQNVMRTNVDLLGQSSEALSELKFFCPSSELQQNNSPNSIASHFLLMKMKKKGDDQQQDSAESSSSDDDEGGGGGGAAKRGSNSSNANNRLRENPRRGGGIQPRRGIISNKISPAPANTGGGGAPFGRSRMSLH